MVAVAVVVVLTTGGVFFLYNRHSDKMPLPAPLLCCFQGKVLSAVEPALVFSDLSQKEYSFNNQTTCVHFFF